MSEFKLSVELSGHSLDVRSVCAANDCIISGSRDKTTKLWEKNVDGKSFTDSLTMRDHSNFVSSVCVINDGKWICTGSNDSTICIYIFGTEKPFLTLKNHTATVCSLAQGLQKDILVSGSWDQTARVWSNIDTGATSIELKGHEAAVWSVCTLKGDKYATGSADKNIFIWNAKGDRLVVLKGHTDCVRGVVGLPDGSLLSCSNDASIRHWSDTYECLKEFHGHSNYIYTIALNPALGDSFVTGSEDNTIRMWSVKDGAIGEAIVLPVQSVWSVACTTKGDVITGSSDGLIRVFSKNADRIASPDILEAYNVAVNTRKIEQSKDLGGVKVNDLPGPESLLQDGTEGQTRLVRQPDGKILCYQWTKEKWECVGDVMGASGGTKDTSGKSLFEGKEYDYVFSVDITDSGPPIKLPYNICDDPWVEAQKFIHKHDLPQVYLEQVANFIITNANITTTSTANVDFADPFTGEGRYIPGISGPAQVTAPSVDVNFRERSNAGGAINVDPFTSGDSYSSIKNDFMVKKHIPNWNYITFDIYDSGKILDKLKDFNSKAEDNGMRMSDDVLVGVVKLVDQPAAENNTYVTSLKTMLQWPKDKRFPVLDVARLAVRNQGTCTLLGATDFINLITDNLTSLPANQLMSIRALNNMMTHGWGRGLVETKINEITNQISTITQGTSNLQIAIASFFLNQSIAQREMPSDEICTTLTISLVKFFEWGSDPEAMYLAYQTVGNLITIASATTLSIVKTVDSFREQLDRNRTALFSKLSEISTELAEKL